MTTPSTTPSTTPPQPPADGSPGRGRGLVAVVGATGQQGGAVLTALLERGARVRALVRDPDRAAGLRDRGAELAVVDLEEPDSLRAAFDGVAAAFAMTTMTGDDGVDGEVRHGRAIAEAAAATSVPLVVYSSVGGADRHSGVPHFESKWAVEQYLHELGVPTVVVRPTFFMDNFGSLFVPQVENGVVVLRAPLQPGVPLQMVAVADIGRAAATALLDPDRVPGGAVEIAGDELTGEQAAAAFGTRYELPSRFETVPPDSLGDDDMAAMFGWFTQLPAYQADFGLTRDLVGRRPTDFAAYAAAAEPPGRS